MAEDLFPTIVPGMVGLKNKKTGRVTNHFPVDAREIMTISAGEYELVENGAVEAARLNANPLRNLEASRDMMVAEVTGVEGQVMVAMSAEQAEAWKKKGDNGGREVSEKVDVEAETKIKQEENKASDKVAAEKNAAAEKPAAAK